MAMAKTRAQALMIKKLRLENLRVRKSSHTAHPKVVVAANDKIMAPTFPSVLVSEARPNDSLCRVRC
jgi:hypothetical protein